MSIQIQINKIAYQSLGRPIIEYASHIGTLNLTRNHNFKSVRHRAKTSNISIMYNARLIIEHKSNDEC